MTIGSCLIVVLFFYERSRAASERDELLREISELRSELSEIESRIPALVAENQQLRNNSHLPGNQPVTPVSNSISLVGDELRHWIVESTTAQSNTVELIGTILNFLQSNAPKHPSAGQLRANVTKLDALFQEDFQRLLILEEQTAALLLQLNIPEEISTMHSQTALDTAALRAYWPFFEVKQLRDRHRNVVDAIKMKLLLERMNADLMDTAASDQ